MRELADGVYQLDGLFPNLINTYLIRGPEGDVLIDAGTRWDTSRILRQLRGRRIVLVALTHVHPDHQGAAAEICRRFQAPLACHAADAAVMEGVQRMQPDTRIVRFGQRICAGPPWPVSMRWTGGETLGEWEVHHLPGHTPGHVIYFRARDRVALVGDVVRNISFRRGPGHLSETPARFSVDASLSRQSVRQLLQLQPRLMGFGHGPPRTDIETLQRLIDRWRN